MLKVAEHTFNRIKASMYSISAGLLIGVFNALYPQIDFSFTPALIGWLLASIAATVVLHEGVHGAVAAFFGYRPLFGIKPPLVYVTFTEMISREQFILITLAPLVCLDVVFGIFFALDFLKVFFFLCLIINTLGAVGDVWMTLKLLPHERGTLVQDTKIGIEIWKR